MEYLSQNRLEVHHLEKSGNFQNTENAWTYIYN